ncbi:hypothetical protein O5269_27305, partial [Escherichia coli]|nr:hypothetical protein [Escherichia coli]
MNRKAFLACVLMCVILTGCETAKKISEVIKNPDIQVGSLKYEGFHHLAQFRTSR